MPLNLNKVEKLLYENKFIITCFYLYGDLCRYLKLFSVETGETMLLFVSSEYEFIANEAELQARNVEVHMITVIDFDDSEKSVVEKYSKYPDDKEMEEKYQQNNLNIQSNPNMLGNSENLENEMENNYNKKIFLNNFEKDQISILKDCYRQLKRVGLSVQDLRYNIGIIQEKYLCTIEAEDTIMCYYAKTQTTNNNRIFQIIADLEYFYEKSSVISIDLESIRSGVYKVLDKNQDTNTDNLEILSQSLISIKPQISNLSIKKESYTSTMQKYKKLLSQVLIDEQKLEAELSSLNEKKGGNNSNYFTDIDYVHQKGKIEGKLKSLKEVRQKILKNLEEIQMLSDNLYLMIDRVEFDSTIMMDSVIKNLNELHSMNLH